MNVVQPIRDLETLKDLEDYFKEKNERDFAMFLLGIYTGLRISDILNLRVRDIRERNYFEIREIKTGKQKRIAINHTLQKGLKSYLRDKDGHEYIIKSRVGKNRPITRERAYGILREAAEEFDLESIGTHTLRKTYGYHFYKQTNDVALLQRLFNHATPDITLRYIGINQDTMDKAMMKFSYNY
jgi:integrase